MVVGFFAWISAAGFSLFVKSEWWSKRCYYVAIAGALGIVGGVGIASPLLGQMGFSEGLDLGILLLFFLCFGLLPGLIMAAQMHKAIRSRRRWQETRDRLPRRGEEG
jgi:hypothetical protein